MTIIKMFFLFFFSFPMLCEKQNLERKEKNQAAHLEQLSKKQIFLKWRCEQLITYNEALSKRRSGKNLISLSLSLFIFIVCNC